MLVSIARVSLILMAVLQGSYFCFFCPVFGTTTDDGSPLLECISVIFLCNISELPR